MPLPQRGETRELLFVCSLRVVLLDGIEGFAAPAAPLRGSISTVNLEACLVAKESLKARDGGQLFYYFFRATN
jgi:hypothetical protein